ncbi:DNA binding protein [Mycobacterium phage Yoshi]|uniref:Helix-turn-helix DNA binding domain protein n=3 Tax=Gracegardnervirinae TaxID=2946632 RepID=G1BSH8_9CAUD|nr:DNA binding protein [Mycobacterium phage Yoshi]YP_009838015.1 DNA binding protein [Mycobacterium phage TChen]YP_009848882.1 DNA binding protein [Mycobacterium phage ThetaBob]AEK07821.1 hypothetical protein YOSHI_71 [Mycobacterium phage Yoshi]AWH14458.1 hypothetical protein SEA_TCHEN_59 [Mycobacterium phage TChen]QDF19950.1 hypothetical protein SEA_THETABOB_63 [Mycobacterium phage ThetaBob]
MTTWKKLTPEQIERIVSLTWDGWSIEQIATDIGCTSRTVTRVRGKHNITRGRALDPIPVEKLAVAARLLEEGASYTEAANTVGCSRSVLAAKFPGRGWDRKQCAEWRSIIRMERAIA